MKKIFIIISLVFLIFSCKKNEEEEKEVEQSFQEVIYTDSFSPADWENPGARIKIDFEDKDIKKIIKPGSGNQVYDKIYQLLEKFFTGLKNKNNQEIQKVMTQAAYNSYLLRIPNIPFEKKYTLRVAVPESMETDKFWVPFKLLFSNKAIISRIEIEKSGSSFIITDIEGKFYIELEEILTDKKK